MATVARGRRSGAPVSATLRNGVRVLLEPMSGVRTACVGVWFGAGSRHDPPDGGGAAHLLEHVVFKGSARRGARSLAEAMDALGGQFNAFTTREHTCFHARTLGVHLPEAIALLAEMVAEPRLAPEDVAREREVVLDELALIADDPAETAEEAFSRALWGDHPLARPEAGTPRSVRGLRAEHLSAFHGRHYVGRRTVVAVAGRLQPEPVLRAIEAALGGLPAGLPAEPIPPAASPPRAVRLSRRSEQAHLVFGAVGPGEGDDDRWATALLASVLGGGASSRLFQSVREDRGLGYDVGASFLEYSAGGEFSVFLATAPKQAAAAAALAIAEVRRLAAAGVPAAELARHRAQAITGLWMGLEHTEARMTRLGRLAVSDLPVLSPGAIAARVRRVTARAVRGIAERLGDPAAWAAAYVGPRAAAPRAWDWEELG